MNAVLPTIAWILGLPTMFFALILTLQLLLGLRKIPSTHGSQAPSCRVLVVVPAHNEAHRIKATLASIQSGIQPGDDILVIADNCTDKTAVIAEEMGVPVLVRHDPDDFGKGFALAWALNHIDVGIFDVVGFIDADTVALPGAILSAAHLACRTGRPVQGTYQLAAQPTDPVSTRINQFAVWVQNVVRQRGRTRLGFGAQLNGSGMFMPMKVARCIDWSCSTLAEDTQITLKLHLAGHPTLFHEPAVFLSPAPESTEKTLQQRTGWMVGRSLVAWRMAPRLVKHGLRKGGLSSLGMCADILTPPTTVLTAAVLASAALLIAVGGPPGRAAGAIGAGGLTIALAGTWLLGQENSPGGIDLPGALHLFLRQGPRWVLGLLRGQGEWKDYRKKP